jgi:hypothetical protein
MPSQRIHRPRAPADVEWDLETASGLRLSMTTAYESETFAQFYASYDKAFILPDEKEDAEGFRAALDLNFGDDHRALSGRFGPFWEICLTAHDDRSGVFVGGANFLAAHSVAPDGASIVTSNLNYIYTDVAARRGGYFHRFLAAVREAIDDLFKDKAPRSLSTLVFLEQNDPLKLSPEQYALDSAVSGIDQFDRLYIWAKTGARIVLHPYVQPPLSDEQAPDETLIYSVLGGGAEIDACVLRNHLARFFEISVLKGQSIERHPSARSQIATLGELCERDVRIGLFDPTAMLAGIVKRTDRFSYWPQRPRSFLHAVSRE